MSTFITRNKSGADRKWTPLPAGTYDVKLAEADDTRVSQAGNQRILIKGEVVDGQYAGKKVSIWYTCVNPMEDPEKAQKVNWRIEQLLEALDIEPEPTGEVDDDGNEVLHIDIPAAIPNRVVRYKVTQREFNEQINNEFSDPKLSPSDPHYTAPSASAATPKAGTPQAAPQASEAAPQEAGGDSQPAAMPRRRPRTAS